MTQAQILTSINPATSETVWKGHMASEQEVLHAAKKAHQALSAWSKLSFEQRAQILRQYAAIVLERKQELALCISKETGKPLWESLTEALAVSTKVQLSIDAYKARTWPESGTTGDANHQLRYKPHGVVAVLGAFNFPAHLSNGHIVPALLAGNTVLYKPSELAPMTAEFIRQCWRDAHLPEDVLHCLQGGKEVGEAILNQDIQGVYFTGSFNTGRQINRHFADRPDVIVALEMGGNNPLLISENIKNIKAAVYNALLSSFITAGQRCTCARRILIPDTTFGDNWLKAFVDAAAKIKVGAYTDNPEPFMGSVISARQARNMLDAQQKLLDMGGESLLSMRQLKPDTGLLSPGIIDMSHTQERIDDEWFGPMVQIYRYQTFEQGIMMANQTAYGLAAGIFSDDKQEYERFYEAVRAGLVNWNRPTTGAASTLPFGGVGHSGNHRPSAWFAADYCAWPVASLEHEHLNVPEKPLPGIVLE